MTPITPHLWFDKEARDAAERYTKVFEDSSVGSVTTLRDTPSGDTDVVSFELSGQPFQAISAGPLFKFNPSISFHAKCQTLDETDALWNAISQDGTILMEYGEYPWSERYGWAQDRFGLSWQVMFAGGGQVTQVITPVLLFVGGVCGRAEEAVTFYTSVFSGWGDEAQILDLRRYGSGAEPDLEGTLQYGAFTLRGQEFGAMDSAHDHDFSFNEAISLMVYCDDQEEIDYFWEKLSAVPDAEQCGWLKDKFGVSWQVVPTAMDNMMRTGDQAQVARVTEAFLKMKKFDLAELQAAYEGQ